MSSGRNADVCSRRGRFRIHAQADEATPGMDERVLGIRLRVYEYRYSLMPDADATGSMPTLVHTGARKTPVPVLTDSSLR